MASELAELDEVATVESLQTTSERRWFTRLLAGLTAGLLAGCVATEEGEPVSEKRGLAYGYHSPADLAVMKNKVRWWYNWAPTPDAGVNHVYASYGMEFVPMAWGAGFNEAALRGYLDQHPEVQYLLGFNEPNFAGQANLTPQAAAAAWPRLEAIARDYDLKLVAPAVNFSPGDVDIPGTSDDFDPWNYLDAFFAACDGCQVDYIAVHCYMKYASAFEWFIGEFERYELPIWVTEWASWDEGGPANVGEQMDYLAETVRWLENNDRVFRYSWFIGRTQGGPGAFPYIDILGGDGELTPLGSLYAGIPGKNFYYSVPRRVEAEAAHEVVGFRHEVTNDINGAVSLVASSAGDYLSYRVNVTEPADYFLGLRVAAATGAGRIDVQVDGRTVQRVSVAATGSDSTWVMQLADLALPTGRHEVRLVVTEGGFKLNWVAFLTEG